MVVVLLVVGFIGAALAEGTRFGLAASRTADRWVAQDDDTASAERVLRALVTDAVADDGSAEFGPFTGGPHRVAFTTVLTEPPPGLHVATADIALGVEHFSLVLRLTPRYPGAPLVPPHPIELVLADHVAGLDITYRGSGDHGTGWRRTWSANGLPLLVRLRIVPAAGRTWATWPDIVAGPFRMQMPS